MSILFYQIMLKSSCGNTQNHAKQNAKLRLNVYICVASNMRKFGLIIIIIICLITGLFVGRNFPTKKQVILPSKNQKAYWLLLHRKSNKEYLYHGVSGNAKESTFLKTFTVKTGIPGERPTPLPRLIGKKYWRITKKEPSDNPETVPYFLTLNIPGVEKEPYGPVPYEECQDEFGNRIQCHWILPGAFGLHGVNGDMSRLLKENPGSSGCIRHRDEDITYLYNVLNPHKEEIRYYIEDV